MKILITGGYGFFGFHLAKELAKHGFELTLLDVVSEENFDEDFNKLISKNNIHYLKIDLLKNKLEGILDNDFSHIFHLAALLGVQNVINNPYKVLSLNFQMLENLISFTNRLNNDPILFFASTSEIYAGTLLADRLEFPTKENSELILPDLTLPRTSYMLSKIYGEAMCNACEFKTVILRPHNLYGPRMGMKHVVPQLIKRIKNTKKSGSLGVYSANHQRTFCFINDAVRQVSNLVKCKIYKNEIFNLGTQIPEIKMKELALKICKIMGREDIKIRELENTPGSPERRCPSTLKLDEISKIKQRTTLDEGLLKTFDWYWKYRRYYLN